MAAYKDSIYISATNQQYLVSFDKELYTLTALYYGVKDDELIYSTKDLIKFADFLLSKGLKFQLYV